MNEIDDELKDWLQYIARNLADENELEQNAVHYFLHMPTYAMHIVDLLDKIPEKDELPEENAYFYSACIFALEISIAQLQSEQENNESKAAERFLQQLMGHIAHVMLTDSHSLNFWLPVLNAFYNVHLNLSPALQDAYLELVARYETDIQYTDEASHLQAIQKMISDLSDLSVFEIAEHFFAQSYAMPPEFFSDLLVDLYNIPEGEDIALLLLLHPKAEVRSIVLETYKEIITQIKLSPASLSRLMSIKNWYPTTYHHLFNNWLKIQRRKEVIFHQFEPITLKGISASEVDGTGAQGIFIHLAKGRKHRIAGLLLKYDYGIKDVWLTSDMSSADLKRYQDEAFDENVTLRKVDTNYLYLITNHFLAQSIARGDIPNLHLLEVQEAMNWHLSPHSLDVSQTIERLAVNIHPFTQEALSSSLKRSKHWLTHRQFTESWFIENAKIDKLVNRCCTIVDGVKVCKMDEAMELVFEEEFEKHRERWLFHFLWITLWLEASKTKRENWWKDSFFIVYTIYSGTPLNEIDVMREIVVQTVLNSMETMTERRTHLNTE